MRIIYSSHLLGIINIYTYKKMYEIEDTSWDLLAPLCLFILLITLSNQDFWQGFRTKLSALKKRLLFSSKEEDAIELILELPKSQEALQVPSGELPSVEDMAKLLIKALPASDRPEAYRLLVTQLLPKKLVRLPTFWERRPLLEATYKGLASTLQQSTPNQRLDVLRAILCECEISALYSDSVILAIARYMQQCPDASPKSKMYWLDLEKVSKWSAMSIPELEQEALHIWEKVEKWDELAKANHPKVWE